MKKLNFFFAAAAVALTACQQAPAPQAEAECADCKAMLQLIEDIPTTQAFLTDAVDEADLQRIVNAGVNAPSALNQQPWHFSVVTNADEIKQMGEAMKAAMQNGPAPAPKGDGKDDAPKPPTASGPHSGLGDSPVVIVISCKPGNELDAGLAVQNMNAMAHLLGYGTKIASSVNMLFNGENKDEYYAKFQVPEGMNITTALLVGKMDTEKWDATTSATPRKPQTETVTTVK
ncbi:MAG: nitroreductase family protein [Bacteroidaceae bacterium]|nr:nitroreductase family protein [Bacteroidaceae bacterium]